jgi:hypothetical protein
MEWISFTFFTTLIACFISFCEFDFISKNKSIENGRLFAGIAFWGGSQSVFSNYDSQAEVIGAILVGTLPLCIIAFFIGYILVKRKDK